MKGGKTMPTPTKPYLVLAAENKSHRTKAELSKRKKAEKKMRMHGPSSQESRESLISSIFYSTITIPMFMPHKINY